MQTTTCIECGALIQIATTKRTSGRCMPCAQRRQVRLSEEEERKFGTALSRFADAGWQADAASKRVWLDFSARLRALMRKNSDRLWEALAICELQIRATKEPGLDVTLTIEQLRRVSEGLFPAENVREFSNEYGCRACFNLHGRSFEVPVSANGQTNVSELILTVNTALSETRSTHRFHPLGLKRGKLLVAFARPETIARSIAQGLCPGAA